MIFTWTVPGSFNIAYGEMSVLFGILFLGACLAMPSARTPSYALDYDLITVAIYGFFAGVAALVVGLRIINLGLTKQPLLSGIGFILTGLGGICAAPTLYFKTNRSLRIVGAIVLVVAALIFAFTGYLAYWSHLTQYSNWKPLPMRSP